MSVFIEINLFLFQNLSIQTKIRRSFWGVWGWDWGSGSRFLISVINHRYLITDINMRD